MLEDLQKKQHQRQARLRSMMHFTVGGLLIVAGILLILFDVGNLELVRRRLLGGLFIVYGCWRIYRGIKKGD